ncbi:MAG: prepilin-type N-terminal cleavage/methylation domain-containing protein [Myxococcales bacterium]|nr:prepilin-type N-terminal cleavage/methylation domain-containing protein [Myxococcales bacterium]
MSRRHAQRGLSLLEVLVAATVLVMVATMIWAAFNQTHRTRERLSLRQENDHLARVAMARMCRDLRAAFLSLHVNQDQRLAATITHFVGRSGTNSSLDLTTFTHRRLRRNTHEGDASEVSYRLEDRRSGTPDDAARRGDGNRGRFDLIRREAPRIDADPRRGGTLDVLIPGIEAFEMRFYDEATEQWVDTWDTTQSTGQPGRLPKRVRLTLSLREGRETLRYSTTTPVFLQRAMTFGLPIY